MKNLSYKSIRTPLDTFNIVSCGGIRQGTFSVFYGVNASGKSAVAYQIAAYFLADNPTGHVTILDPETSADLIRLRYTFGLDLSRVTIKGVQDIEDGFQYINEICEGKHEPCPEGRRLYKDTDILNGKKTEIRRIAKEWNVDWNEKIDTECKTLLEEVRKAGGIANPGEVKPHLVIWDSLSASSPRLEMQAAQRGDEVANAGGMMLTPRVLKTNLKSTSTAMYGKPITVIFMCQVSLSGFGSYQGPTETFSGGSALKHACHYILHFQFIKKLSEEGSVTNDGTLSRVKIEKSKFSPTSQSFIILIDDRLGGRIVPKEEALLVCMSLGIVTGGSWLKFKGEEKSFRFAEASGNPEVRQKCIEKLAHHFRSRYLTIEMAYREVNNNLGKLTDEEWENVQRDSTITLSDPNFVLSEK